MGTVRFVGETEFAAGEWCGIELGDPIGKNDGTVQGRSYFSCKPKHGLFEDSAGENREQKEGTQKEKPAPPKDGGVARAPEKVREAPKQMEKTNERGIANDR